MQIPSLCSTILYSPSPSPWPTPSSRNAVPPDTRIDNGTTASRTVPYRTGIGKNPSSKDNSTLLTNFPARRLGRMLWPLIYFIYVTDEEKIFHSCTKHPILGKGSKSANITFLTPFRPLRLSTPRVCSLEREETAKSSLYLCTVCHGVSHWLHGATSCRPISCIALIQATCWYSYMHRQERERNDNHTQASPPEIHYKLGIPKSKGTDDQVQVGASGVSAVKHESVMRCSSLRAMSPVLPMTAVFSALSNLSKIYIRDMTTRVEAGGRVSSGCMGVGMSERHVNGLRVEDTNLRHRFA